MVHALREIGRVLVPGGLLLDVRPFSVDSPVEVVVDGRVMLAGRLDEPPDAPDDVAANAAVAQVEQEKLFVCERRGEFEFIWYWDVVDEMKAHIAERWTGRLPESVAEEARRLLAEAGQGAWARVRRNFIIARLRKL